MFHKFKHKGCIKWVMERLMTTYDRGKYEVQHMGYEMRPSRAEAIELIEDLFEVLYPGYFGRADPDRESIRYYLGSKLNQVYERLSRPLYRCLHHRCQHVSDECINCENLSEEITRKFFEGLPELRENLDLDVQAAYDGDPAAKSLDEIIFCYPGLFALTVYRIAHQLHAQKVPLIPRIMTEYAHSLTGIDIHPGAHIGESFFIDHGTGLVIGETTEIGDRVRIYQGVTLGALSVPKNSLDRLRDRKRHPTVEDGAIIYANATILGGRTVIGARAVIGGNVWITNSVPPDTEVFLKKPELVVRGKPSARAKT